MMSDNLAASVDRAALHRSGTPRIFDAIVIGAGAAGGLAAELLTTAGRQVGSLRKDWPRSRPVPVSRSYHQRSYGR